MCGSSRLASGRASGPMPRSMRWDTSEAEPRRVRQSLARICGHLPSTGGHMRRSFLVLAMVLTALTAQLPTAARQAQTQTPEQFFGFRMGTDGELARYPKILEYYQHLSKTTDRMK